VPEQARTPLRVLSGGRARPRLTLARRRWRGPVFVLVLGTTNDSISKPRRAGREAVATNAGTSSSSAMTATFSTASSTRWWGRKAMDAGSSTRGGIPL